MHVRFPIDHDVLGNQASGDLADAINGRRAPAIHVAAHLAFDERGAASHCRAAQVALRRDVDFPLSLDRAAEAGRNFVTAQVDMRAALRAETRGRRGTDFVFRLAIEAFDLRTVEFPPKSFELLQERVAHRDRGVDPLLFWPEPDFVLGRRGREMRAALAAHRALGGSVLRLLEPAVWTFHTEFCRRRLCGHWQLWRKATALDSSPER